MVATLQSFVGASRSTRHPTVPPPFAPTGRGKLALACPPSTSCPSLATTSPMGRSTSSRSADLQFVGRNCHSLPRRLGPGTLMVSGTDTSRRLGPQERLQAGRHFLRRAFRQVVAAAERLALVADGAGALPPGRGHVEEPAHR